MEQHCPVKCTSSSSVRENVVLQWAFKLNSALAAAETWHLKDHTLKIRMATVHLDLPSKRILDIDFEFTQPKHVIYIGRYEGNSESRTFFLPRAQKNKFTVIFQSN
jgi:hypothetical protein